MLAKGLGGYVGEVKGEITLSGVKGEITLKLLLEETNEVTFDLLFIV